MVYHMIAISLPLLLLLLLLHAITIIIIIICCMILCLGLARVCNLGSVSERAKGRGGSLVKVGSLRPVLLRHVTGRVRYGRGRKSKHKTVSFGQKGASDYTKHKNADRKDRYIDRHKKNEDCTKSGAKAAGFYIRWITSAGSKA